MLGWIASRSRRSLPVLFTCGVVIGVLFFTNTVRLLQDNDVGESKVVMLEEEVRGLLDHGSHPSLVEDKPVLLHILAYQRTASSVISKTFGDLKGQFFIYEPLDMAYTSLYSTAPGWNIPSDIFNSPDGQIRSPGETELQAMRSTMDIIFNCRMSEDLPLSFLVHPFWLIFGSAPMSRYKHCITSRGPNRVNGSTLAVCQRRLRGSCGGHYNSRSDKLEVCKEFTWENGSFTKDFIFPKDASPTLVRNFQNYQSCLKPYEKLVRTCAKTHLDGLCKEASIRVIKTVRANMVVPEVFFKQYENFRLMHLFRDARGTVKSRMDSGWSLGSYDKRNLTRVAQLYCQNVVADIEQGRLHEEKYPGRMLTMLSDDFIDDPLPYVEDIASLIGKNVTAMSSLLTKKFELMGIKLKVEPDANHTDILTPTNATLRKVLSVKSNVKRRRVRRTKLKGEKRLQRWQTSLTWAEVRDIEHICSEFYSLVDWVV
ncbi:hypothetical protein CAPTEDRAFT_222153 [Capitella teleta]|uniref:Sulfotransferase domain-containing protein n=1 Tax=Capitella teleta TaxID=283909 RepID=X2ASX0_CAPTE|nr:hypothetical protein CAPTEDRAFT_222153 [Capitella teleta]|eukprot:ELT88379.1 hypothetical protein CAPTEDRAFT_222153 [Capitella teleta]